MIRYDRTLTSACAYAEAGRLEEWIHLYLLSDGNNVPFSEGLKDRPRTYLGPVQVPLRAFPLPSAFQPWAFSQPRQS